MGKKINSLDKRQPNQSRVVIPSHPLHKTDAEPFNLEGTSAIEGLLPLKIGMDLLAGELAQGHRIAVVISQ